MIHQSSKTLHRIAVVDDDAGVRNALRVLLQTASFDVRTFKCAREFIAELAVSTPECAIIDLHMPEMSGLELQHYLTGAGIGIPTVVVTAYDEVGTRDRCLAAGASAYLVKPLRKVTLISAIQTAIEGH
jgi:FixJ family two-component response regulator